MLRFAVDVMQGSHRALGIPRFSLFDWSALVRLPVTDISGCACYHATATPRRVSRGREGPNFPGIGSGREAPLP
jgi:hypothetical protein